MSVFVPLVTVEVVEGGVLLSAEGQLDTPIFLKGNFGNLEDPDDVKFIAAVLDSALPIPVQGK